MTSALSPEIAVGIYGLRTFRIREDGYLLPVIFSSDDSAALPGIWGRGFCVATCLTNSSTEHEPPVDSCGCGIYSWNTLARLQRNYRDCTDHVVAVVALEGQTIEGFAGFRSQAARIVALWLNESLAPVRVQRAVRRTYPGIAIHHDRTRMISHHLSEAAAHSAAPTERPHARFSPRRPLPAPTRAKQSFAAQVVSWCGGLARALWWLVPVVSVVLLIGVLRHDVARMVAGVLLVLGLSLFPLLLGLGLDAKFERDHDRSEPAPRPKPARAATPRPPTPPTGRPVLVPAPLRLMS
ncbi:hypothetical protein AADG42_04805 [Ammonicoccus fulvus]|uniref:Uncharacterized protein n=1 Tax=Ammonicoccus fulvus TaxID=3138240 RepID=A0ABZ3FKU2_9ACTN